MRAREVRTVTAVAGEVDPAARKLEDEGAPQRAISIEWRARREMLRLREHDGKRREQRWLPPVQLLHFADSHGAHERSIPERRHDERRPRASATRCAG